MRVGVVGAGITGLALTHHLAGAGVDVVTFEAADEPGGVIRSERVDGRVLEHGPQRLRLVPAIEALVEDVGLAPELLVADDPGPLYVYADGALREVPRSVPALLRTDLLSWRGKLRLLAEPATGSIRPAESAADAFERKFGREAYRNVIEPLFGGIYASDPAEMPAAHALSRLRRLEEREGSLLRVALERTLRGEPTPPPASFRDGLGVLPRALYERHEGYVHLDTPVTDVASVGDGYRLETGTGSTRVDVVVVTVPAGTAAALLDGVDDAAVAPLGGLTYNSLALVHLSADVDVAGFGYQVRRDESLHTRGVTWNASLFDRDGVFTAFFGGMGGDDVLARDDDDLARIAREEFRTVLGGDPDVLGVTRLPEVLPAYDDTWSRLDDVDLPDDVLLATNYTGRVGIPGRVREARRIADRIAEGG